MSIKFKAHVTYSPKHPFVYEMTDMQSFVNCFEPNHDWKEAREKLKLWALKAKVGDTTKVTHAKLTRIE
jgi:hypothetical protein